MPLSMALAKSAGTMFGHQTKSSLLLFRLASTSAKDLHRDHPLIAEKDLQGDFPDKFHAPSVEKGWYQLWRRRGLFSPRSPSTSSDEKTFSLVLPPPNVTGTLHLGHALTVTVQDAIVRRARMLGLRAVWVPGSDHAGIATQAAVERHLSAAGKPSRRQMGREEFLKEVWAWRESKGQRIFGQLERMGAALDWDRTCYTLSQHHTRAVNRAFCLLFDRGLIFRQSSTVNWCPTLRSTISDIEVEHVRLENPTKLAVPGYEKPVEFGRMHDIAYRLKDGSGEVVVSTTRPETLLGDTGVAVNPSDARHAHLIGRELLHPFREDSCIPVVGDEMADAGKGSGAVKVTPAHSAADLEVARRHGLDVRQVFGDDGRVDMPGSQFHGIPRFKARGMIIKALKELDLYRGHRPHAMSLPTCSRTGDVVEAMVKSQWFVRCDEMASKAIEATREGRLTIQPAGQEKVWEHWLENIRDWCISRQLWWGHRIPLFLCRPKSASTENEAWFPSESPDGSGAVERAAKSFDCPPSEVEVIRQEDDVLDTWFSSAIVPFANFGWPDQTQDLQDFYPLSLMETGHDILFYWVARMVMLGQEITGQLPFDRVLLHGMICDARGRKMSKSVGNVVDPMHVIDGISLREMQGSVKESLSSGQISQPESKRALETLAKEHPQGIAAVGVDALRYGLCSYDVKGHYINLDLTVMRTASMFCNKIWQSARFLWLAHRRSDGQLRLVDLDRTSLRPEDRWILARCARTVADVNDSFERGDFHFVCRNIRQFLYSNVCDNYLELCKPHLSTADSPDFALSYSVLHRCLATGLLLLHPVAPFLTEELYHRMPVLSGDEDRKESIMEEKYPTNEEWSRFADNSICLEMDLALEVVRAARALKTSFGVPERRLDGGVTVSAPDGRVRDSLERLARAIQTLARTERVDFASEVESPAQQAWIGLDSDDGVKVCVDLRGLVDVHAELAKREKRLAKLAKQLLKVGKDADAVTAREELDSISRSIAQCHWQTQYLIQKGVS